MPDFIWMIKDLSVHPVVNRVMAPEAFTSRLVEGKGSLFTIPGMTQPLAWNVIRKSTPSSVSPTTTPYSKT
jgi:hypothetical protein